MEVIDSNIAGLTVKLLLSVIVVNAIAIWLWRLVKRYLFVFITSEIWKERIYHAWNKIEIILSIILLVGSVLFLLNQSVIITSVLLIFILVLGGRYWIDAFSGWILKFENRIAEGDFISSEAYKGTVLNLGFRGVQLRLKDGELAFVPYRKVVDFSVRKLDKEQKNEMNTFQLQLAANIPVDKAVKLVEKEVLQIPYTILSRPVMVEVVQLLDEVLKIRVVMYTRSTEGGKLAERALNMSLKKKALLVS